MFRSGNGELEFAMTHRVGAEGVTERCLRPKAIRETAERMQRWGVTPEGCQSCHHLPAVRCSNGMALCGRCHATRAERLGRTPWSSLGLAPHAERADDVESSSKKLHGYAIRFNEKSVELWGFFEIIRPSAADRMAAEKPDMRYLWSHDSSEPLGRVSAGTLTAVKRSRGVWIENEPPRWADKHIESVARRDVTGQSFGFIALEDDWHLEDGFPVREVLDMEVIEFSAVAFPAYPTTTVKVVNAGERSDRWIEQQTAERLRMAR